MRTVAWITMIASLTGVSVQGTIGGAAGIFGLVSTAIGYIGTARQAYTIARQSYAAYQYLTPLYRANQDRIPKPFPPISRKALSPLGLNEVPIIAGAYFLNKDPEDKDFDANRRNFNMHAIVALPLHTFIMPPLSALTAAFFCYKSATSFDWPTRVPYGMACAYQMWQTWMQIKRVRHYQKNYHFSPPHIPYVLSGISKKGISCIEDDTMSNTNEKEQGLLLPTYGSIDPIDNGIKALKNCRQFNLGLYRRLCSQSKRTCRDVSFKYEAEDEHTYDTWDGSVKISTDASNAEKCYVATLCFDEVYQQVTSNQKEVEIVSEADEVITIRIKK